MAVERHYSKLTQMAINSQLNESEIQKLLVALRSEYLANKVGASLHYDLACHYLRQYQEVGEAYKKAISLGIEEANALLCQVIQINQQTND